MTSRHRRLKFSSPSWPQVAGGRRQKDYFGSRLTECSALGMQINWVLDSHKLRVHRRPSWPKFSGGWYSRSRTTQLRTQVGRCLVYDLKGSDKLPTTHFSRKPPRQLTQVSSCANQRFSSEISPTSLFSGVACEPCQPPTHVCPPSRGRRPGPYTCSYPSCKLRAPPQPCRPSP